MLTPALHTAAPTACPSAVHPTYHIASRAGRASDDGRVGLSQILGLWQTLCNGGQIMSMRIRIYSGRDKHRALRGGQGQTPQSKQEDNTQFSTHKHHSLRCAHVEHMRHLFHLLLSDFLRSPRSLGSPSHSHHNMTATFQSASFSFIS